VVSVAEETAVSTIVPVLSTAGFTVAGRVTVAVGVADSTFVRFRYQYPA
jgi:hypothetical protein